MCQSEGGNKKAEESVAAMGVECLFPLSAYKKKEEKVCNVLEKY